MTDTTTGTPSSTAKEALPDNILDHVEIACEAILGCCTVTIGQLNAMARGQVLKLDRSPSDLVDIKINGKTVAQGEIVTVDDRFGIRLTEIG